MSYEQSYVEYLITFLEDKLGKSLNITSYTITPEGEYVLISKSGEKYSCTFA